MQGRPEPNEMVSKPLYSQRSIKNDLALPLSFRIDIIEDNVYQFLGVAPDHLKYVGLETIFRGSLRPCAPPPSHNIPLEREAKSVDPKSAAARTLTREQKYFHFVFKHLCWSLNQIYKNKH